MKGVILAGGLGSRLHPMTRVTNKHLLPVYDRPMIYYPIQQLVHAGVENILLVTGGDSAGDFLRLLGNGHRFGLRHLNYTYQEGEGGIADALGLAEHFADGEPVVVILGDNIFQDPIGPALEAYARVGSGATILLKEVPDPERFGVARLEGDRIVEIVEKPDEPRSNLAVTGCYVYDARVFDIIQTLAPSGRGELEITDVNNRYLEWGELRHHVLGGWWTDAGTVSSLYRATQLVADDPHNPLLRSERPGSVPAAAE
jgi:glucose-1-phosphate thymidylyltransferase